MGSLIDRIILTVGALLLSAMVPLTVFAENYDIAITSPGILAEEDEGEVVVGIIAGDTLLLDAGDIIEVEYSVVPNTASEGADYTIPPILKAILTKDQTEVGIVNIKDDSLVELDEEFEVTIISSTYIPDAGGLHTTSFDPNPGTVTITSDDHFEIAVSPGPFPEQEEGIVTVSVTGGDPDQMATDDFIEVTYTVVPGTAEEAKDYSLPAELKVKLTKAQPEVKLVDINDDGVVELDETFEITIISADFKPADGGSDPAIFDPAPIEITITNNDTFEVTTDDPILPSFYEDQPPEFNSHFTINLSRKVAWAVEVKYQLTGDAVDPDDYTVSPATGSVTFTPDGILRAKVTIDPLEDMDIEPDESLTLTIVEIVEDLPGPSGLGSIGEQNTTDTVILNDDYLLTLSSNDPSPDEDTIGTVTSGINIMPPAENPISFVVTRESEPVVNVVTEECYDIKDITIDGTSIPDFETTPSGDDVTGDGDGDEPVIPYVAVTTYDYVFDPIEADHVFNVEFGPTTYAITTEVLNPENGTITESFSVDCKSIDHEITATANDGHTITWFKVDGELQDVPDDAYEFTYTIEEEVTSNIEIEVAFSNKIYLTHVSPHGEAVTTSGNESLEIEVAYGDGTDFFPIITQAFVHSVQGPGAVLRTAVIDGEECKDPDTDDVLAKPTFDTDGNLTNSPVVDEFCNYIDSDGKPIYDATDGRTHRYHLSKISDNGEEVFARCLEADGGEITTAPVDEDDTFYDSFTSTDYSSSNQCFYALSNITGNHEIEILYTSYLDLRATGAGSMLEGSTILVNGTAEVPDNGQLEIPAGGSVTVTFEQFSSDWYIDNISVRREYLDEDRRVEDPEFLPSMVSLGGVSSYSLSNIQDENWALQALFSINMLTIRATSTFEQVLYYDADLTTLVSTAADNEEKIVTIGTEESFYIVIDDEDFAVVGVAIDGNFISITSIREYAADVDANPESETYKFIISTVDGKERLEVRFLDVRVSHSLEVRDYDGVVIADIPLDAQSNPNPPTVMFVLDDSGSMDWEFMVSGNASGLYLSGRDDFNDDSTGGDRYFYYIYDYPSSLYGGEMGEHSHRHEWRARFALYNTMFYKPTVTYAPWPTFDGDITIGATTMTSQLPSADNFDDRQAHADLYRPRYHAWHDDDCSDALAKSAARRSTSDVSSMPLDCGSADTFPMDDAFQTLVAASDSIIKDESTTSSTAGGWEGWTTGDAYNDDYWYNTSGTADAKYSFTTEFTGTHDVEVSWVSTNARSTEVQYRITCGDCVPEIDETVIKSQRSSGDYDDGMVLLGSYTFQTGKTVEIEVSRHNGSGSISLDAARLSWYEGIEIINAHYFTWNDTDQDGEYDSTEDIWLVNLTDPIVYVRVLDKTEPVEMDNLDSTMYTADTIPTGTAETLVTYASPFDPDAFVLERQNFADWFSYYRSRAYSAVAGISLALDKMSNVRVGFKSINSSNTYGYTQSALPVNVWGERDKTKYLYYLLYDFQTQGYGTPLVAGLQDVAEYLDGNDGSSGDIEDTVGQSGITTTGDDDLSPYAIFNSVEENGDRCKQAFSIVVTDGYWNGSTTGALETSFDGLASHLDPIYQNTLAHTAYDYYVNQDLMGDSAGEQQVMITYGVAFGVTGDLTFSETCTFTDPTGCPDPWNEPVSGGTSTVDDLWHAAVGGGGEFLSADSPDTLVDAIAGIINSIGDLEGSSTSLAASGDEMYLEVDGDARIYQPSWNSDGWWGDLLAYSVDPTTGDVNSTALWSAADTLNRMVSGGTSRIIATYNDETEQGVPFRYASISDDQKIRLAPYYSSTATDEDVLDFLRGDKMSGSDYCVDSTCFPSLRSRAFEDSDSVVRNRILGDIVNSTGAYQEYYDSSGNSIGGIIFIGANDGMLHAFSAKDSDNGKELFAYVPNLVFHNLRVLAQPDFDKTDHLMFVDNSPVIETLTYNDSNGDKIEKTILISGLGKGGKGYFALEISDAFDIQTEAQLADRVLWEFPEVPDKIVSAETVNFSVDAIQLSTALSDDERDAIIESGYVTIHGSNYNSGSIQATNDGTYLVEEISTDKLTIFFSDAKFTSMSGIDISIFESSSDHDMGYSFAEPILVKTNDRDVGVNGWVVIFGNGYGSDNGDAVLFMLHPLTGEEITTDSGATKVGKITTNSGPFNGLSTARVIDVNNDLRADYVYAGDLLGNMWKFDLYLDPLIYDNSDSGPAARTAKNWQVAFCTGASSDTNCRGDVSGMVPKPLFSTPIRQAITGAPDIMRHETNVGYMVIFGTGKYLGWTDLISTDEQSLYGIWDWAPDYYDLGFHGARADNEIDGYTHVELTNWADKDDFGVPVRSLLRQTFLYEGVISEDLNGDDVLSDDEDIDGDGVIDTYSYYRIPTFYEGDWSYLDNDDLVAGGYSALPYSGSNVFKVPTANLGWVVDLPGKIEGDSRALGERMVNDAIIRDGKAIMVSFGFSGDKCGASAYSFLNERDANNGGMLSRPVYDLDEDGVINEEDELYYDDPDDSDEDDSMIYIPTDEEYAGRMSNPVIGERIGADGKPIEDKYLGGSANTTGVTTGIAPITSQGAVIEHVIESAERRGVYYWKQVH